MLTLLYHNVIETPADHLPVAEGQVSLKTFSEHVYRFRRELLNPMDVHEELMQGREPRGVLVTFDDGAAGIVQAGEILAGLGAAGVAFVCPGALDSGVWFYRLADMLSRATVTRLNYRNRDLPLTSVVDTFHAYRTLSPELFDLPAAIRDNVLAELSEVVKPAGKAAPELTTLDYAGLQRAAETRGLVFANHSWSHPNLVKLAPDELDREIGDAQSWLEASGLPAVPWFAFPRGDNDARVRDAVGKFALVAFGAGARKTESRVLPRTYLCEADANRLRFAAKTAWHGRLRRYCFWR